MTLHLKHMVCARCIRVVREEAEKIGLKLHDVQLGEVEVVDNQSPELLDMFQQRLLESGFELVQDRRSALVEKVKSLIIDCIHHGLEKPEHLNYSAFLEKEIGQEYTYLSRLFSEMENLTIEKFIIQQKIERVKELLVYEEQTLSEIAFSLSYSSPQHLSTQFKAATGLTPSQFKASHQGRRIGLEKL